MKDLDEIKDPVEIEVLILNETTKAFRVLESDQLDYDLAEWIPKSQIHWDNPNATEGDLVLVTMPEWLATDKGFA